MTPLLADLLCANRSGVDTLFAGLCICNVHTIQFCYLLIKSNHRSSIYLLTSARTNHFCDADASKSRQCGRTKMHFLEFIRIKKSRNCFLLPSSKKATWVLCCFFFWIFSKWRNRLQRKANTKIVRCDKIGHVVSRYHDGTQLHTLTLHSSIISYNTQHTPHRSFNLIHAHHSQ